MLYKIGHNLQTKFITWLKLRQNTCTISSCHIYKSRRQKIRLSLKSATNILTNFIVYIFGSNILDDFSKFTDKYHSKNSNNDEYFNDTTYRHTYKQNMYRKYTGSTFKLGLFSENTVQVTNLCAIHGPTIVLKIDVPKNFWWNWNFDNSHPIFKCIT